MLVQCTDKVFYRKPMWYNVHENKRWLVNFNAVEELELSIEVQKKTVPRMGEIARAIMKDWCVKLKIGVYDETGAFPDEWELAKRWKWVLEPESFLPIPREHGGIVEEPSLNDLKYCWEVLFPIKDVWEYFQVKPFHLSGDLCDYLLGGFNSPYDKKRNVLMKLKPQFPEIIRLNLLEATTKYGTKVRVLRNGTTNWKRQSEGTQQEGTSQEAKEGGQTETVTTSDETARPGVVTMKGDFDASPRGQEEGQIPLGGT